jgi:hypothetical protein
MSIYFNANVSTEKVEGGYAVEHSIGLCAHTVKVITICSEGTSVTSLTAFDHKGEICTSDFFGGNVQTVVCSDLADAMHRVNEIGKRFSAYRQQFALKG